MDLSGQLNKQHGGCEGELQSVHQPFGREGAAKQQDMIQNTSSKKKTKNKKN